jgi:hypothetical protein
VSPAGQASPSGAQAPSPAAKTASPATAPSPAPTKDVEAKVSPAKPAATPKPSPAPAAKVATAKSNPPAATTKATPSASTVPASTVPPATVPPAAPKSPPLDLESLKSQLKATKAIGVMTKLTLKNQVDDLLDRFRGFYAGRGKDTMPELRQAYDLLLLKVLSLLQDRDQMLASKIVSSREAIWGLLADRQKFAALQV